LSAQKTDSTKVGKIDEVVVTAYGVKKEKKEFRIFFSRM
jgi:hypothetical protein